MKYEYLVIATAGIIIFLLALNIKIPGGLTGAATIDAESYAYTLQNIIQNFYGIYDIRFPKGTCTQIAEQLYLDLAMQPMTVTSGYDTNGNERVATLTFGIDRHIGIADMVKGRSLTNDPESDSMLAIHTETVVRIPPDPVRMTFYNMELHGTTTGNFIVNRGSFSTPTLDCSFISVRGIAQCQCETHPQQGIQE